MRRLLFIVFAFTLSTIALSSCGSDDDGYAGELSPTNNITCSNDAVSLPANGGTIGVTVTANREWGVSSSDDWIMLDRSSGVAGQTTLNISADQNPATSVREGTVTLLCGADRIYIKVKQEAGETNAYPAPEGYELVWHDEFNEGSELNSAYWTHEVQNSGWVNNELQNYVNHKSPDGTNVTEIKNGNLNITCLKENGKIYSGRVYATVNTGWQYGYIEARIKLPSGKGTWPAFWMMPCNVDWATEAWPYCGEIDIMEEVGCVPNEVSSSLHASGHNHTNGTQITHAMTIDKAEGEFHVYALEWTAKKITTYVDGNVQLTYDNPNTASTADPKWNWPYDRPYYVILNLAWGGSWGGMNGVDESALPVTMEVDYVRVFQKK